MVRHMSADDQDRDSQRLRDPPSGPWGGPWGAPRPEPRPQQPAPQPAARHEVGDDFPAFRWSRLASVLVFVVIIAGVGVRAYRDLSRPEAWAYWKDQYMAPTLSATVIPKIDIDQSGRERTGLAISGRIGPAAASWLRARIDEAHLTAGDVILLSSPGGDLTQGILMGEIIRAHGLGTAVGTADSDGRVRPAYCASACVFTYAGGKPRYGVEASALGVHRFVSTGRDDDPVADTQRVTGAILGYMTRMGVASSVVEAMSQTRDIRWLDEKQALAMNLITAPVARR